MAQRAGRVADQREGLARSQEGFYQLDRVLVFGEIPHRPVAAWVEDGVEVLGLDAVEANRCRELRLCACIGFEPTRKVRPKVWLVAFRIERRLAALWRGNHDLGAGVLERVVGGSELLEPKARLTARVAELVVRGQNHHDLHKILLSRRATSTSSKLCRCRSLQRWRYAPLVL